MATRNRKRNTEIRAILVEAFPQCFMPKGAAKKPLALGVGSALVLALPEIGVTNLGWALDDFCAGPTYLRACVEGAPRIGLDGKQDGVVTASQAAFARSKLAAFEERVARQIESRQEAAQ